MTLRRLVRKTLRFLVFLLGFSVAALIGIHFWFKYHAKEWLQDLVESSSNGKVKLKIHKLHFNYFTRSIRLENAVFYSTDTVTGTTSYQIRSRRIDMKVKALLPLLLKKKILIDSLRLTDPLIEVTRLRNPEKEDRSDKKELSIPAEMGKVYTSIQDALEILKVKRFHIDEGVFRLSNKADPGQLPLTVSHINFSIDNLIIDTTRYTGNEKILFSDNVVIRSHNQDILFPDGRHRLSFREARINLRKKLVTFDSCTIAATRTENNPSAFRVYFDALNLTRIDFDTLYKTELIKADSVYCVNPSFDLEVDRGSKKEKNKRSPRLENILRQLAGELELGFVVVNNAGFHIRTLKNDVPTTFSFTKNNFEVQGLRVRQDAANPISVKSFAMAIRNYENFIRDSSYRLHFDSVLFRNDNLTLSNFLMTKQEHGKVLSTYSIPEFTLRGLSWDDLLFDRTLTAEQAILFRPVIRYSQSDRKKESRTLFQSLGLVNEFMDLQQLDIIEGTIDLRLRNDLRLLLDDATLSVKSQSLLASKKLAGIRNSLTALLFRKGKVHTPTMDIELNGTRFNGETGRFDAALVRFGNKKKNVQLTVENVGVEKMQVDETGRNLKCAGARWKKGTFFLDIPGTDSSAATPSVELTDIAGTNTRLQGNLGGTGITAQFNHLAFDRLEKLPGRSLQLDGFAADGSQFEMSNGNTRLSVPVFSVADKKRSRLQELLLDATGAEQQLHLAVPSVAFTPDIHQWLNRHFSLGEVTLPHPEIRLEFTGHKKGTLVQNSALPTITANRLKLLHPFVFISSRSDSGQTVFNWRGTGAFDYLDISQLQTSSHSLSASALEFFLSDCHYRSPGGRGFETGNGTVQVTLQDLNWEHTAQAPASWKTRLLRAVARDLRFDSIGRNRGNLLLESGSLADLDIGSSTWPDLRQLVRDNKTFRLHNFNGSYRDSVKWMQWANASFDRRSEMISLDSFRLMPALPLDSFIKKQSYQADYLQVRTGSVKAGRVDLDRYIESGMISSRSLQIDSVVFSAYKDRSLPFRSGIIKPMPSSALEKIPAPFSIDTAVIGHSSVMYTEVQEKTREPMVVPLSRVNLRLLNLGNRKNGITDSLRIFAGGSLFDSLSFNINVSESYADSLDGFRMEVHMQPVHLSVLNPVLGPLNAIQIVSGQLDTLNMLVTGNDRFAYGKVNMLYRQLKIQFRQAKDAKGKRFLLWLKTFIANNLLLRRNNRKGNDDVFFTRMRDRSAIQYLVRITLNGASAGIGLHSNKKQVRQLKKEKGKTASP